MMNNTASASVIGHVVRPSNQGRPANTGPAHRQRYETALAPCSVARPAPPTTEGGFSSGLETWQAENRKFQTYSRRTSSFQWGCQGGRGSRAVGVGLRYQPCIGQVENTTVVIRNPRQFTAAQLLAP